MVKPSPLIFQNENVSMKQCKHGYFAYNTFDDVIGSSLHYYGEWCEHEIDFFKEAIHEGDVVLDVGAYIGTHTVFFAKQVGSSGKVFSFEPQPTSFRMLCTNLTLNAVHHVSCFQAGVSDSLGQIKLPPVDPYHKGNYGSLSLEGHFQGELGEGITVLTIDSLSLKRCDLIKVDVEGMESKVIKGAQETIKRFRPILYVENNRVESSSGILQMLQDLNYRCWWHFIPYYNENNYFKNSKNIFKEFERPFEANVVCFPIEEKVEPKGLVPVLGVEDNWEKAMQRRM